MQKVLVDCFAARELFCGDNPTFGARAAGNVERLRELCKPLGIGVHIVPMAQYNGQTVSSTRIRAALSEGCLADANAMLGEIPMPSTGLLFTARASAAACWVRRR